MNRILALDPALAHTACVVFEEDKPIHIEVVNLPPSKDKWLTTAEKDQQRIMDLSRTILGWVNKWQPSAVCTEQYLGGGQTASTVKALSLVAGMQYALAAQESGSVPWTFVRVHDVKRALVGKAHATKDEMISEVVRRYPELLPKLKSTRGAKWKGEAEHIADAIAVYVAFRQTSTGQLLCRRG